MQEIGFSEAEVKALAATYQIADGPNDAGDMFQRPGKPSDYFPLVYTNENAARAVQHGAVPPDLSLIIKAREEGPDYVYSLLTGFSPPPADVKLGDGQNYNPYFPGGKLMMPPPLSEGQVTYQDGTPSSVDQMSRDVVTFLQWAAEPEMEARKQMGLKVLIYLAIFTAFMYIAKRNIWRKAPLDRGSVKAGRVVGPEVPLAPSCISCVRRFRAAARPPLQSAQIACRARFLKRKEKAGFQEPVLLEADEFDYDQQNDVVTATGHVEITQGDTIMLADTK